MKLNPIALGTPLAERKLPIQGMPREYSKFLLKRERNIDKNLRPPSYGLGLELAFTEIEPALDHSLADQFKKLQEYTKVIINFLSE